MRGEPECRAVHYLRKGKEQRELSNAKYSDGGMVKKAREGMESEGGVGVLGGWGGGCKEGPRELCMVRGWGVDQSCSCGWR